MVGQPCNESHNHSHNHDHPHDHAHILHGHGPVNHSVQKLNFACHSHAPYLVDKVNWKDNETILDYGCNNGGVTSKFFLPIAQARNSRLFGVDINSEAIESAKTKCPELASNFFAGDITGDEKEWPLKDLKFDKVVANHVLHNIEDIETFLERMFRILNDGGELAAVLPYNSFMDVRKYLDEYTEVPLEVKFHAHPSWAETIESSSAKLRELLPSVGFKVVDFSIEESADEFPDIYGLVDLMQHGFVPKAAAGEKGKEGEPKVTELSEAEEKAKRREFLATKLAQRLNVSVDVKPFVFRANSLRFVARK